ncbi:hypothetical protein PLICRDRAFT_57948 [Plicaturopsis crispa FD-325 SS-3]|uniref:STE3-domain-containing protein n=1 Tax=Plicaturopsis crispa FD-325 SS-3 TaxID=944288 RepID=A0A0C9T7I1_PLICR|nr:hypothetical protein PLICRDRAFT_57948 [Plicaturopsis crispa FD-325 SS-3]
MSAQSLSPVADVPNQVFSAFAFIGFVLVSIPLPWHLEAWNTGTCLYMVWAALACLNNFINSVVWNNNAINWAPLWCDISTKFMIGASVAIPAASLCINRRLYYIASVQSVTITKAEKRRSVITDLSIGLGIPLVQMVLHVIVQGHRFNIFEDIGCYPATFNTPPAYPLVFAWPLFIGVISAVYCVLTIRAFARRRSQFNKLLSANNNLNQSRYFRLMALAGIELLFTIPLGSWSIYLNARANQVFPYVSWASAHFNFNRVDQYPAVLWRLDLLGVLSLELSRWLTVFCALLFFAFFGFADEARKHYKIALFGAARRLGIPVPTMMGTSLNSSANARSGANMSSVGRNMPVFVTDYTSEKRGGSNAKRLSIVSDNFTNFTVSIADYGAFDDDAKEQSFSGSSSSSSSLPSPAIEEHRLPRVPPPVIVHSDDGSADDIQPTRPPHTDSKA